MTEESACCICCPHMLQRTLPVQFSADPARPMFTADCPLINLANRRGHVRNVQGLYPWKFSFISLSGWEGRDKRSGLSHSFNNSSKVVSLTPADSILKEPCKARKNIVLSFSLSSFLLFYASCKNTLVLIHRWNVGKLQ